jgi:hypothetical protein
MRALVRVRIGLDWFIVVVTDEHGDGWATVEGPPPENGAAMGRMVTRIIREWRRRGERHPYSGRDFQTGWIYAAEPIIDEVPI